VGTYFGSLDIGNTARKIMVISLPENEIPEKKDLDGGGHKFVNLMKRTTLCWKR